MKKIFVMTLFCSISALYSAENPNWDKGCVQPYFASPLRYYVPQRLDTRGHTPLTQAAKTNNFEQVQAILANEAISVNEQTYEGETALLFAVANQNLQMIDFLLSKHASPDICNIDGASPLHLAAKSLRLDIVNRIISTEVNVNALDCRGNTPLHYVIDACYRNNTNQPNESVAVVLRLLNAGALRTFKNYENETPIQLAQRLGQSNATCNEIAQLLQAWIPQPNILAQ